MKKILFVCHGNICRSPMAEAIFKRMLDEARITDIEVDSAAVSSEELGNSVYPQANSELQRHGLPRSKHRAWQISAGDYDRYDYFLCMDRSNVRWAKRTFGGDPQDKIHLILSFCGSDAEVENPWYTDRFDVVFQEIKAGCKAFLTYLTDQRQIEKHV